MYVESIRARKIFWTVGRSALVLVFATLCAGSGPPPPCYQYLLEVDKVFVDYMPGRPEDNPLRVYQLVRVVSDGQSSAKLRFVFFDDGPQGQSNSESAIVRLESAE